MLKKVKNDEQCAFERQSEMKERLEIERKRLDLEKKREENCMRVEMVRVAGESAAVTDETKKKINTWLENFFATST